MEPLISMLDEAMTLSDLNETTHQINRRLCRLIGAGSIDLSAAFDAPASSRYARRLLHRNMDLGYSIVVMTWGPGQATPVHDHLGMWCIEGVLKGKIEVDEYELIEHLNDRYYFEKRGSQVAGVSTTSCLMPPYEYHRVANPDAEDSAITIHVYGGDMTRCHVFEELADGWYRRSMRALGFD